MRIMRIAGSALCADRRGTNSFMPAQRVDSFPGSSLSRASREPHRDVAIFALFVLLALVVLGPYMSSSDEPFTGEGSTSRQLGYMSVFIMILWASRVGENPRRLLAVPLSLTVLLGWCWLSLAWALDPYIAIRRLGLTTLIIWTIFMVVRQLGFEETFRVIRWIMVLVLAANYLAVIGWPAVGIHQVTQIGDPGIVGDWRGILQQKNFAGAMCALTILTYVLDKRQQSFILRVGVILATAYFLYRTSSKTSMGLLVLSLCAGWAFTKYDVRYRTLLIFSLIVALIPVVLIVHAHWDQLVAPFNSEDALTGRVQIWPILLAYWHDNWLLGAGFGSFWNIGPFSPVYRYAGSESWVETITSGHNGYLDLVVQIGLPGLVLAVVTTIVLPLMKLLANASTVRSNGALLMAFLVFCAGHNMTESSLLDRDAIVQVFLMFTIALIHLETRPPPTQRPLRRAALRGQSVRHAPSHA